MALTGSDKAYVYARSGIAVSGASRSNYVDPFLAIGWSRRDASGAVTDSGVLTGLVLLDSLHITQTLNDDPDTCSLEVGPQNFAVPRVGDEIRVTVGTETLFNGYVVISQSDWRLGNLHRPWTAIQCQDAMWRFDARIVTFRFKAQSVTESIAELVRYFCNLDPVTTHPLDFNTTAVVAGMPSIPSFEVVNQRPSTVMRTLTATVGGGFYVDGLTVHAWANSLTEPNQQNPVPLTVALPTLKSFRLTTDATQLRRRVLVEGRRASTAVGYPTATGSHSGQLGVALTDAAPFVPAVPGPDDDQLCRIGSQWMLMDNIASVTAATNPNPPQTKTNAAFDPALASNYVFLKAMPMLPPPYGWVRVGNQYARYSQYLDNPLTGVWRIEIAPATLPYGRFTALIPANETVEWVDGSANLVSSGVGWRAVVHPGGDDGTRAQPVGTEVVTLAFSQAPPSSWPDLEALVQDGRYSYEGAQARAEADRVAFMDPLVSVEWVTEDVHASPGRSQVIALTSAAVSPAINLTVTILSVELSFPLRTLPPRRACTGGVVKPSTFLDLVVTTDD